MNNYEESFRIHLFCYLLFYFIIYFRKKKSFVIVFKKLIFLFYLFYLYMCKHYSDLSNMYSIIVPVERLLLRCCFTETSTIKLCFKKKNSLQHTVVPRYFALSDVSVFFRVSKRKKR